MYVLHTGSEENIEADFRCPFPSLGKVRMIDVRHISHMSHISSLCEPYSLRPKYTYTNKRLFLKKNFGMIFDKVTARFREYVLPPPIQN